MQRYFRIDRVVIDNYRSIVHCDVRLGQITFLVGPNGSGKSNFVDALKFVADSLRRSLNQAAGDRLGIHSLLPAHLSPSGRMAFGFEISSSEGPAIYSFTIGVKANQSITVEREECSVGGIHHYLVSGGVVQGTAQVFPPVSADRLFLVSAAGLPQFRPVFDFLSEITVGEPMPPRLHLVADHYTASGMTLRFRELRQNHPARADLIQDYLRAIAEPFESLVVKDFEDRPRLTFVEKSGFVFFMSQVSSGLLHSTQILLDLFEPPKNGAPASLVAVEEPEALLHPGAVSVIRGSFLQAKELRQILVTSHSPDLLDDKSIPGEWIRVVRRDDHGTHIEALDSATESIIRDQLFTAGELLRQGGLRTQPEPTDGTVA